MSVNDIKKHIHGELLGKSIFPNSHDNLKSIENIKGHWKKETIQCSIRIMRNHNQTDTAIREMLETKFFLDEEAIRQFLKEKE